MKKIIFFVVLFASLVFAQTKNSYELLSRLKQTPLQSVRDLNPFNKQPFAYANEENIASKKNPGLAVLYSLLLPGMGELYAGSYETGKYFTIADGTLWGIFTGFNLYGNWQRNNYRSYAQSDGYVNPEGKNSAYFATIGIYQDIYIYNREQELNRDFDKVYDVNRYYWKWNTNEQRKKYREMWSSSENAYNNVRFVVGALILNRLISAISAVRAVSRYNSSLENETSWNVSFGVDQKPTLPSSLTFNFTTSF